MNDLASYWIFAKPKLIGDVTDSFWLADFNDALSGNDCRYLVLLVTVCNIRVAATSVKRWMVEIEYYSGASDTIVAPDDSRDPFWSTLKDGRHPGNIERILNDAVFVQYVHRSGWLRFPVSLYLREEDRLVDRPQRFTLLAVDGRGKTHTIAKAPLPDENVSTVA